jgi:hypothetical protein
MIWTSVNAHSHDSRLNHAHHAVTMERNTIKSTRKPRDSCPIIKKSVFDFTSSLDDKEIHNAFLQCSAVDVLTNWQTVWQWVNSNANCLTGRLKRKK